jgi:hypothetical protein
VGDNIVEAGLAMMQMRRPVGGSGVDFDISPARAAALEF